LVLELLAENKRGKELGERPRIEALNTYLEDKIELITTRIALLRTSPKPGNAQLDELL
jgi:hypothetical protein